MTLYLRHLEVTIGPYGGRGQTITGHRVTFEVKHTRSSTPSGGELAVYNLSDDAISAIADGEVCVLRAGYDDAFRAGLLPIVLRGDVTEVSTTREGPDRVTRIVVGDGDRVATTRAPAMSFDGQSIGAVVRELLGNAGDISGAAARDFVRQVVADPAFAIDAGAGIVTGTVSTALDALMPPGYGWTAQDGALVVVPPDGVVDTRAVALSSDTGMVGVPRRKRSSGSRSSDTIEVRILLMPELRPGRLVDLRSSFLSGVYVVTEVEHRGDTHGQDWYTDVDVEPR